MDFTSESHAVKMIPARAAEADLEFRSGKPALDGNAFSAFTILRETVPLGTAIGIASAFSVVAFLRFGWTPGFWAIIPLLIALAIIIVLDLRAKFIPDVVTLPAILYALAAAAVLESPPFSEAVVGALAGGGILLLLAVVSRGAFGGGDIKLMAMLGAVLGWKAALVVLGLSQLAVAVLAVGLLISGCVGRRALLPVGAFIALFGAFMLLGRP